MSDRGERGTRDRELESTGIVESWGPDRRRPPPLRESASGSGCRSSRGPGRAPAVGRRRRRDRAALPPRGAKLFLDEPTAVLEPGFEVDGLLATLRSARRRGTAIVLVTHKLGRGRAGADGSPCCATGKTWRSFAASGTRRPGATRSASAEFARAMVGTEFLPAAPAASRRPATRAPCCAIGGAVKLSAQRAARARPRGRAARSSASPASMPRQREDGAGDRRGWSKADRRDPDQWAAGPRASPAARFGSAWPTPEDFATRRAPGIDAIDRRTTSRFGRADVTGRLGRSRAACWTKPARRIAELDHPAGRRPLGGALVRFRSGAGNSEAW